MKTKSLALHYNPNDHIRDFVYTNYISKRPRVTWTPTKKQRQDKLDRIQKQKGWF